MDRDECQVAVKYGGASEERQSGGEALWMNDDNKARRLVMVRLLSFVMTREGIMRAKKRRSRLSGRVGSTSMMDG